MSPHIFQIWNPDTGIIGLDAGWNVLRAHETDSIRDIWKEQQDRLRGTDQLKIFSERLSREWAHGQPLQWQFGLCAVS